jgi:hypothetical protein
MVQNRRPSPLGTVTNASGGKALRDPQTDNDTVRSLAGCV